MSDQLAPMPEEPADPSALPHWSAFAPSKVKLALTLGPIIAVPIIVTPIMWVGRPWMVNHAPLLLMGLSNKVVNMALAVIQVNVVAFYAVAILRRLIFCPCYFYLGRWGADAGLQWMADNSPSSARLLERIRRWFPRFGPVLLMFYPASIVRVLAGASKMRFWVFMVYEFIGAAVVAIAVRTLALKFPEQLKAVLHFIAHYTWQLTIASIAYVLVLTFIGERRRGGGERRSLQKLEATMEASIEESR